MVNKRQLRLRQIKRSTSTRLPDHPAVDAPQDAPRQPGLLGWQNRVGNQGVQRLLADHRLEPLAGGDVVLRAPDQTQVQEVTHVVQQGESLRAIAQQYGVSIQALVARNQDKVKTWGSVQGFNAGETITIPSAGRAAAPQPAQPQPQSPSPAAEAGDEATGSPLLNTLAGLWQDAKDVWNGWFGGDEQENESAGERQDGAAPAPASQPAIGPAAKNRPAYKSQTDNATDPSGTCNVTTLAMQLETMAGDADTAKDAAVRLLRQHGSTDSEADLKQQQLEDLLMKRFAQIGDAGWKKLADKKTPPLYKGFEVDVQNSGKGFHQNVLSLRYVAMEFDKIVSSKAESTDSGYQGKPGDRDDYLTKKFYQERLVPALEKDATIMISTLLTSGHIMLLVEVQDDGVVVNDPYGLFRGRKSAYFKNGAPRPKQKDIERDLPAIHERLKLRGALARQFEAYESLPDPLPDNLGESNFFSWADVEKFSIGKWYSILRKA